MPNAEDVYINCDDLAVIPALMRANYLYESELLVKLIAKESTVLQIGSMDGERGIRLLGERPDLQLSGLEIEESLVRIAERKIADAGFTMKPIHGAITQPPKLPVFDYVICLNNTLGYIPEQDKALAGMRKLGKNIIVSVYGEKFTDKLAKKYFDSLGLIVQSVHNDMFIMKSFTAVKRYLRVEVQAFSNEITETPAGYFCILSSK